MDLEGEIFRELQHRRVKDMGLFEWNHSISDHGAMGMRCKVPLLSLSVKSS